MTTIRNPQPPRPCRTIWTRVCEAVRDERLTQGWQPYPEKDLVISNPDAVGGVEKLFGISWPSPWPLADPLPPGLDDEDQYVATAKASLGGE